MTEKRKVIMRRNKPDAETPPKRLRSFRLGEGYESITAYRAEIQDMMDVLLGRKDPPIDKGVHTMQEVADAYFARGMEMQMKLHEMESHGEILRGSMQYKFRTGELRDFIDIAKAAAELGSRRLTAEQLRIEQEMRGLESHG